MIGPASHAAHAGGLLALCAVATLSAGSCAGPHAAATIDTVVEVEIERREVGEMAPLMQQLTGKDLPEARMTLRFSSRSAVPLRKAAGEVVFCDVDNEAVVRHACRLHPPSTDGAPWTQIVGLFSPWLCEVDLANVRVRFEVQTIEFADGTVVGAGW